MSESVVVRPMQEGDLPGILDTLRAALGETALLRRTPEQWHWKHTLNPFGESIVLVATDGARIAGVRAFMRWRLIHPDIGELSAVRPVDTAVHPDYQRRGLFGSMNEAAIETARADGVDLVFNTPNAQSRAGYLKQGWQDVGAIGVMVRPSIRFLTRRSGEAIPEAGAVLPGVPLASAPMGPDRPPLGLRTVRSEAYWKWRFEMHPTASYVRVDDGAATALVRVNRRRGRDELVVSELIGTGGRPIAAAAKRSTSGYLIAWFSPGSPERRQAIRTGIVPVPGMTALNLVARPLSNVGVDVFDLANWDLALSDLELL